MSQPPPKLFPLRFAPGDFSLFLVLVGLGFCLLLLSNPSSVLPRTTLYFDAAHYLESCKRLHLASSHFFSAGCHISKGELDSLAYYLLLDGPVLPGAGALLFFCLNKLPAVSEWQSLVLMQCLFQAGTAGFLYLIAKQLFHKTALAILAAALWTTYSATIASCNSYLTEPLACLLAAGLVYFLSFLNYAVPLERAPQADAVPVVPELRVRSGCLVAGAALALLALLKPALAPAAGLAALLAAAVLILGDGKGSLLIAPACLNRRTLWRTFLFILGLGLVFLPWLSFGVLSRGAVILLPSRRPVYNITTGCNIEGDGWGCYPTHPVALMYDDNEPALPVLLALVEQNPAEIANLSLRKIGRLWNLPWNDYRYRILGLNFRQQALWHLLLLLLGIGGVLLLVSECIGKTFTTSQKLTVLFVLILIGGHLIYLPFEGIARYGYTAMPFWLIGTVRMVKELACRSRPLLPRVLYVIACLVCICLFKLDLTPFFLLVTSDVHVALTAYVASRVLAIILLTAAFLWVLSASFPGLQVPQRPAGAKLSYVLLFMTVLLVALAGSSIAVAFGISNREAKSWQCTLKGGSRAERRVIVNGVPGRKPDWALLLIDGDQRLPEAAVFLNRRKVSGLLRSLYQFDAQTYELEDWLNQFGALIRKPPDSIRRWRAVEVPVDSVHVGWNSLMVEPPAGGAVTIYGDFIEMNENGLTVLPSHKEVSPGKFFNDSEDAFDSRIEQNTYSRPAASQCIWLRDGKESKKDLSPSLGIQTGDYRMFLLLGYSHKAVAGGPTSSGAGGGPEADSRIEAEGVPRELVLKPNSPARRYWLKVPGAAVRGTHLAVQISGKARSAAGSVFTIAGTVSKGDRLIASILPGTPCLLKSTATSERFFVESEIPCQTVSGANASLAMELKSSDNETVLEDLQVEFRALTRAQFKQCSVRYY